MKNSLYLPSSLSRPGLSRRRFFGGLAATMACLSLPRSSVRGQFTPGPEVANDPASLAKYDSLVKLSFNENPYGPPESVIKAMTQALKYSNRYGYPDGGILRELAAHHSVKPENLLLGAGSTEILGLVAEAFAQPGKKVIGAEPTFGSVYEFAT